MSTTLLSKIMISIFLVMSMSISLFGQIIDPSLTSIHTEKLKEIKAKYATDIDTKLKKLEELKIDVEKNGSEVDHYNVMHEQVLIFGNTTAQYEKALEYSIIMEKIAKKIDDNYSVADVYQIRGLTYKNLNFTKEALEDLTTALKYLDKVPKSNDVYMKYCIIYNNIAALYTGVEHLKYLEKSQNEALKIKEDNSVSIADKYLLLAYLNYQFGDYYKKIGEIEKSKSNYEKSRELFNSYGNAHTVMAEIGVLNKISSIYYDEGNYEKSIKMARNVLKLQKAKTNSSGNIDSYDILHKSYLKINKNDSAIYFMDLYTEAVENSKVKSSEIQKKAISNYMNHLKSNEKSKVNTIILISITAILLIGSSLFFYFKKLQKKQKKSFEEYVKNLKTETLKIENNELTKTQNELNIPLSTYQSILDKLILFEKKEKYLNKNLTLASLASDLDINTKYLSQIINEEKGKNFNNYINSLRIKFITQKLIEDPNYSKYKITHLAEISGFSSREVFAQNFKKETGVNPSYFINQINSNSGNV